MVAEYLRKTPFFKIVLPFIIGILVQLYFPQNSLVCLMLIGCTISMLMLISLFRVDKTYGDSYLWGIVLTLFLLSSGLFLTELKLKQNEVPQNIYNSSAQLIEINNIPVIGKNSIKTTGLIKAYKYNNKWYSCNCKANIYFRNENNTTFIQAGNLIVAESSINQIGLPISPLQFSYSQYCYYKGIQCQINLNRNKIIQLKNKENNIKIALLTFREYLLKKLQNNIIDKKGKAVLSSLVLGFTGDLDNELRTSYAAAGTIHILSVSGLHVGIVYLLLLNLFFFLNTSKLSRVLRFILIIAGIWFYAIITGFNPPVVRSAVMFSFFAAGESLNRSGNGLNTLAASAFFILMYNPLQLTDIGFQLSYSAILGIMFFHRPIYSIFEFRHWFPDKIWTIAAVSISAQIGTLPVSLFNYHQFPLYFILSNLVVVPLATVVLYGGIILIVVSSWHWAATFFGYIMKFVLVFLNEFINHIEHLPHACIRNIFISTFESILLALMIISIAFWIRQKQWQYIYLFLISILIFTSSKSIRNINSENQRLLVVHNLNGKTSVSILNGKTAVLFTDSLNFSKINNSSGEFYMAYNINKKRNFALPLNDTNIEQIKVHHFAGKNLLFSFNNKKIILLNDNSIYNYNVINEIQVDYLIVSNSMKNIHENVIKEFKPSHIIYLSARRTETNKNVKENENLNFKKYFVVEQGVYETEL